MKQLPDLTVAVQYYRQPTPRPGEWDGDLAAIKRMGFDAIQVRPQWRGHERNEGELCFDDIDRLFDLAEKHRLRVIFKFFLPAGPQWLFDKYDAHRRTPAGEIIHPIPCGSVYVGGLMPCFDKDLVRRKANRFLRAAVRRYRGRPALLAWNAWNEPRSRPAGDCACPDSMRKYRAWLRGRFGTIETYNEFTGLAVSGRGANFRGVTAPTAPGDYVGWLLFRTWRAEMVADRLRWVAGEIRKIDKGHTVMCHVGFCSALQDVLEDTSHDYLNARPFDLFGSSCPSRPDDLPLLGTQPKAYEAATVDLICARLRGVSDPFWINEIYGNRGMYVEPLTPAYLRQATYGSVAGGAKGLVYWQYRSERLSTESNDAGLTKINGEPTDRSREVARVVRVLKKHRRAFAGARVPPATVGVLYDFSSDLISRIETAAPGPIRVEQGWRENYPYKSSLRGIHLALWELDIPADIVPSEDFERLLGYDVAYLPCPRMISARQAELLARYVKRGGLLISEPSPGMRDPNGWVSPNVPPAPLAELFGCREVSRIRTSEETRLRLGRGTIACPPGLFLSAMKTTDRSARAVGSWRDGAAVVSRKLGEGRAVLLGAPLGEIYFRTRQKAVLTWLTSALRGHGVRVERLLDRRREDVRTRRLVLAGGAEIVFVCNYRRTAARVAIRARGMRRITELSDLGLRFARSQGAFRTRLPAEEILIVRLDA